MCSTPVGIKDRFTLPFGFFFAASVCAQRLSASKIGSLMAWRSVTSVVLCSTPVGIKDRFTRFPWRHRSRL